MNETKKPTKAQPAAKTEAGPPGTVFCRRVKVALPIAEHKSCPYCFGKESDIKSGDHDKFCDFQEGKDPICFGFPET
jgi:hypothetical protein